MKKGDKTIFIIVGIVFVVGVFLAAVFGHGFSPVEPPRTINLPERNDTVPQVSVMFDYGTKIVYTTNTLTSKDIYANDCAIHEGTFNTCGNICAPAAKTCSAVCALTCTIK